MKFVKLSMLVLASAMLALFVGCSDAKKMKELAQENMPKLTPNPLVYKGGKVEGKISGRFPAKYFHKKAQLEMTPILKYQGGELELPSKIYQGQDVTENYPVVNYEMGGNYSMDFSFDYKPEMMKSEMELRLTVIYKGTRIPFDSYAKLGIGVNVTPLLVDMNGIPVMMPHNFVRNNTQTKEAKIYFQIQQANVRNSQLTQEDVRNFQNAIKELSKEDQDALKKISIYAYASPDGPATLNANLSKSRARTTHQYLDRMLKRDRMNPDVVDVALTETDWEGFKEMVQASNIEDKDMILRVLAMYSDPAVRNREMHNMGKVFQTLAVDILPKLRRSRMVATIDQQGRSDEEIIEIVSNGNIDQLELEEALFAVTLMQDLVRQEELYRRLNELNPDNAAIHNNLAGVLILEGKYGEAKSLLERVMDLNPNIPQVLNNLGVIAMHDGNMQEAERYFNRAMDAGEAVKLNLGACAIMSGDYQKAVQYLAGSGVFNQGLALLLVDRLDAAKNVFTALQTAKAHYGLAIIGAHNNDESMVISNLREAFRQDANLKAWAAKDVEFNKWAQNEVFLNLVR